MDDVIGWLGEVDGATIIDPFAGSGTTCVACEKRHVPWIAIEIDSDYCDIIRKRVESV